MIIRSIILVTYIAICSAQVGDDPIVNTALGTIRGVRSDDGTINMYMGIPYARVNESNPFGAALPYPAFDEVFEANDDTSKCPQIEQFNNTFVGDLDCLRLNINTPADATSNSRLPVLVWIYAGRFRIGFYGRFLHGPKYIVPHDVILVTINYRVGPYGFMCLDIPEVPGNEGFKDQIKAFRWLKSHISAFGGDPDRITVAGNSAGGMSIDFHLLRDNSEEQLFERAIIQSGTSKTVGYSESQLDAPLIFAKHFGFQTNNVHDAIAFLANVPPKDMIEAQASLDTYVDYPCIEKPFPGVESYMTKNWLTAPSSGVKNMTVMIGVTDDEAGLNRPSAGSLSVGLFLSTKFDTLHEDYRGMNEIAEQFYIADKEVENAEDEYSDFIADVQFVYPTYRSIYGFLENDVGNIYLYNFSYVGNRNFVKYRENVSFGGAFHADEIGYMFDMIFIPEEPNAEDQLMIDKMTKLWTNFVKYGDPTPERTDLIDVKWEPIRPGSPMYSMNIDKQLALVPNPIGNRVTFLDMFYEKNGHLELLLRKK